ncbi:MAG: hypothetical protein OJF50_003054 [Nitrospira sp.]|nr:hypothetical protein [Nitrospira sp.]
MGRTGESDHNLPQFGIPIRSDPGRFCKLLALIPITFKAGRSVKPVRLSLFRNISCVPVR